MTLKRIRAKYSTVVIELNDTNLLALVKTQQLLGGISKNYGMLMCALTGVVGDISYFYRGLVGDAEG